jgi:mannose-1-phosphate guanylyltransferase
VKALILAGGFGTRLRPLTYTRPKHLLPIANRPHIEHVLDMLEASGVRKVVLLTSYLADAFAGVQMRARERGLSLTVAHEVEPLDTAGALKNAEELVGNDVFLALNGDILSDIDLTAVIEWHLERDAEASIVLTPVSDPSAYGVVPTEQDGKVIGFIEKPAQGTAPTNMINAGIYVMEPSVLDRIPTRQPYNAERELFPELAESGRLYAVPTDAYWMDIGTPEKYLQANLDALAGQFRTSAVPSPGKDVVLADVDVAMASSATVSSTCIGARTTINHRCIVERSVLLPGVVVGESAKVVGCVVGEDARVAPGAQLSGAAVADGQTIS